jgi:hypothetical protein
VEPEITKTVMHHRVTNSVLTRALLVTLATAKAVSRRVVAIGEAGAFHPTRPAIARIEASAHLTNLAEGTRSRAIAAETGVCLGIDALESTTLEIGLANAGVCLYVADFVVAHALVVDCAPAQALAGFHVAVSEAAAACVIGPAIAWIETATRFANESYGAAHGAIAAETRVGRCVHALRVADFEWRFAADPTNAARAAISAGAAVSVGRRNAPIIGDTRVWISFDRKLGVGRKLAGVVDRL